MLDYPSNRPRYFAMRVGRQLIKTAAAQIIGPLGALLVNAIAVTEDAANYSRPVTFWDPQLMLILGVKKQKELAAARSKAVDAGWLQYRHGTKGVAGLYFVTIPEHANCDDDSPSDEGIPETGTDREQKRNRSGTDREQIGNRSGTKTEPFLPIPIPVPVPVPVPEIAADRNDPPPAAVEPDPADPVVLTFPVVGGSRVWDLTESKLREWQENFPDLDVIREANLALQWVRDNPSGKKTAGGMTRFLNSWLTRSQNSGRARQSAGPTTADPRGNFAAAQRFLDRSESNGEE